jgi:hypothetical protein
MAAHVDAVACAPRRQLSPGDIMLGGIWIGPGSGDSGDGHRADRGHANAVATVRAALAAGVREFDTAPWYGAGASEERLGLALAALAREVEEQDSAESSPDDAAVLRDALSEARVITKTGRLFSEPAGPTGESGAPCLAG